MIICPYCGFKNLEGILYCEDCGQSLKGGNAVLPTKQLEQPSTDLAAKATWGTARFGQDASIIIHVRDASQPVVVQPAKRTILGRSDTSSTQKPDVDLTPYGAIDKGVSRIHAAIYRNEDTLTLIDMGSANGTHLNGQRLVPDQPRILRDGDEIRLGKLVAHIYFK
ncbi:MAG TPA: FHA domain-containing protein [Phototrophicaceae bacterium]|nr:FHA domain-containing protein [Phototrophicaceae bacterium]